MGEGTELIISESYSVAKVSAEAKKLQQQWGRDSHQRNDDFRSTSRRRCNWTRGLRESYWR